MNKNVNLTKKYNTKKVKPCRRDGYTQVTKGERDEKERNRAAGGHGRGSMRNGTGSLGLRLPVRCTKRTSAGQFECQLGRGSRPIHDFLQPGRSDAARRHPTDARRNGSGPAFAL